MRIPGLRLRSRAPEPSGQEVLEQLRVGERYPTLGIYEGREGQDYLFLGRGYRPISATESYVVEVLKRHQR